MRSHEIREMDIPEIEKKITDLKNDLSKQVAALAIHGVPENVGRIRHIRRTIARLCTIKREKELGILPRPGKEEKVVKKKPETKKEENEVVETTEQKDNQEKEGDL